ncbi:MAG: thiamine diphosphokinase [Lachnospiraceae bacterium]|nr:thiamine diphosphokinase [Lachnospiraceae bacterium]
MKQCLLICAGESDPGSLAFYKEKNKDKSIYIIAADGGVKSAKEAGLVPDLIVGDFDSLEGNCLDYFPAETYPGIEIIRLPKEKDDTDTVYALRIAASKGIKEVFMYGCGGGRMDHYIANIQTLLFAKNLGMNAYLYDSFEGKTTKAFVIKNEAVCFDDSYKGLISVFCIGDVARGVDIKGLKYEVSDGEITNDFPIGVSNELIGKESCISVKSGVLLIFLNNAPAF